MFNSSKTTKKLYLTAAFMLSLHAVQAQKTTLNNQPFRDFNVGVSLGTTGVGVDASIHITDYVRARAGFDVIPHFNVPMSFSLQSYTDGVGVNADNFDKLQKYMYNLTKVEVDDMVEMDGTPTMTNFKLLFDVYPWKSKGWRATVGFYAGSRKVAKAVNTMSEMPSLIAVQIYNKYYEHIMSDEAMDEPFFGDIYLDPYLVEDLRQKLEAQGQMGIHVGDFKDGTPYMMQPDKNSMVKTSAFVNSFKPYVGLGYTGDLLSENQRWKIDVDCGVMIWGGSPKLITHDGTDLTHDVTNIKGKPGDYVDLMKSFKVYPVVSVRFAYTLF